MSDEQDKLKLSLEPPKLFGRKKKSAPAAKRGAAAEPGEETSHDITADAATTGQEAAEVGTGADSGAGGHEPVEDPADTQPIATATPATAPVAADPVSEEPVSEDPASEDPGAVDAEAASPWAPGADHGADAEPTVVIDASAPDEPDTRSDDAAREGSQPRPAPVATAADTRTVDAAETAGTETVVGQPAAPDGPDEEPEPRKAPLRSVAAAAAARASKAARVARDSVARSSGGDELLEEPDEAPLLTVYRAAALTGLVVGAALVALTWLALRGCEAVRGTASCGGGPGLLLLVTTFAVCVYLGAALLRVFLIPGPGSTSFLAVGVVAVIALLFLVDVLDHWSMVIVVPLIAVAAFMGSVFLTTTYIDPADA